MTKTLLTLSVLLLGIYSFAQEKVSVYISLVTERMITESEYEQLKRQDQKDLFTFLYKETKDSLIYVYKSTKKDKADYEAQQYLVGKALPHIELKELKGNIVNSDAFKGKVVYINFWTTTCGPCRAEFPELNRLQKKYKDSAVVFLSMAPETDLKVKSYLKKYKIELPILANTESLFNEWHIVAYPTHYFIDKRGIVREITRGTSVRPNKRTGKREVAVFSVFSEKIDKLLLNGL
jgi:thiol-disulfide isomerase/thioredoxin